MVTIDSMLWCSCAITLTGVIALLLYRHVWRILPIFCTYCIWDLLSNIAVYAVHYFHPSGYLPAYLAQTILDSVIEFCVVVELTWAVLRPIRASLPRSTLVVIGVVFFALGAVIWPFAVYSNLAHYTFELRMVLHLQRTVSMLRILLFLLLAACSQLLSIGWRDRELQVATGLGFMSLVSITVSVVQPHLTTSAQYVRLNQLVIGSFLCCLLYWVFNFARKEAERRAFTPQMQKVLLAVAGAARTTRVALEESHGGRARKQEKR